MTKHQPMYNVVYYWRCCAAGGEWKAAYPRTFTRKDVFGMVADLNRQGFVAHAGNTRIGPPEGPPRKEAIDALTHCTTTEAELDEIHSKS